MSSITYAGHDFSDLCSAKVVERAACSVLPEALAVPGRAGALVVSGYVPPVEVSVRLFLDPGFRPTVTGLAEMRHRLRSWLTVPEGGTLTLPDDPDVEYRDALLTYADDWSSLFEDGSCDVVFTLFDPIAWGDRRVERDASFVVGGTRPTWPSFCLIASAGNAVQVTDLASGKMVRVERTFVGGEIVDVDCSKDFVFVGGMDARVDVALGSDFFSLAPGAVDLAFAGCSDHECWFCERWA